MNAEKKYIRRLENLKNHSYTKDDADDFAQLRSESVTAANQARMLCETAEAHLFGRTK